jgi:DNA polymerase-4
MSREILHLDLDAFFCAVEELHKPELRGVPFAVGGRPDERGVVASCSYAARSFGVRSAMPMSQALRLCPGLLIVCHRHGAYGEMSRAVMGRLRELSPLVEQISIDEAFVEVTGLLSATASQVARELQSRINAELQLPCSIGVAGNKLTAKIATEVGKKAARGAGYPNAITVVPPGGEAAFLAPLPVEMLWGVGPKTARRLADLGIRTIGDLAAWPPEDLGSRFGDNGRDLARHSRGLDDRPIVTGRASKSISQEETFARDVRDDLQLETALRGMAAEVARRAQGEHLAGTTVKLKLRWPDFSTVTRQVTLSRATDRAEDILPTALELLRKLRPSGRAVRLIGIGLSGLSEPVRQLGLWETDGERSRKLQQVVDALQQKYGAKAIQRGGNPEVKT